MTIARNDQLKSVEVVVRTRWRSAHRLLLVTIGLAALTAFLLLLIDSEYARFSGVCLCALLTIDSLVSFGKWNALRHLNSRATPRESVTEATNRRASSEHTTDLTRHDLESHDLKRHDLESHDLESHDLKRHAGLSTGIRVFVSLAFAGLLAASLALDARFVAIGALIAFLALALFGGPAWLAAVGDEEEYTDVQ